MDDTSYTDAIIATCNLKLALDRLWKARGAGMFVPNDCLETLADAILDCASHEALATGRMPF